MATPMKPKLQFRKWFIHDWEAKLVALILAFLLWSAVKAEVTRGRPIPMPLNYSPVGTVKT